MCLLLRRARCEALRPFKLVSDCVDLALNLLHLLRPLLTGSVLSILRLKIGLIVGLGLLRVGSFLVVSVVSLVRCLCTGLLVGLCCLRVVLSSAVTRVRSFVVILNLLWCVVVVRKAVLRVVSVSRPMLYVILWSRSRWAWRLLISCDRCGGRILLVLGLGNSILTGTFGLVMVFAGVYGVCDVGSH